MVGSADPTYGCTCLQLRAGVDVGHEFVGQAGGEELGDDLAGKGQDLDDVGGDDVELIVSVQVHIITRCHVARTRP